MAENIGVKYVEITKNSVFEMILCFKKRISAALIWKLKL
jgi:hypothetical protein